MSAIAAIWHRHGQPIPLSDLQKMFQATPYRSVSGTAIWHEEMVALGEQLFCLAPEFSPSETLLTDLERGVILAWDGRLDNRLELQQQLKMPAHAPDSHYLLAAYHLWGTDCPIHLLGDFAFVLWDSQKQALFASRDSLGVCDLCYYLTPDYCLIASEIQQLLAHPAVQTALNEQKVATFLAGLWHNQSQTFYNNIYYCPPAHSLYITAQTAKLWCYWQISPQTTLHYSQPAEYSEQFLELLQKAIHCRLRTTAPVGISLSGGIDSAAIAALAACQLPHLHSFSYTFDQFPSCDERSYIQPVVEQYKLQATYLTGDDAWFLQEMPPVLPDFVYADPFVALPLRVMAAAQAMGCRLLLTGHFSDILFAGGQYWLASWLWDGGLTEVVPALFRHHPHISLHRDLLQYGLLPLIPAHWRQWYRQHHPRSYPHPPHIHPHLLPHIHQAQAEKEPETTQNWAQPGQWARWQHLSLSIFAQGGAISRQLYNQHGLEAVDPYQDRRLVEFVMAVPAHYLGRPYYSKWLLRQALQGYLPDKVRERTDKTRLTPLLDLAMQDKAKTTIARLLSNPQIIQRQFIRPDWLQQALAGQNWAENQPLLVLCICLELWLQRYWL